MFYLRLDFAAETIFLRFSDETFRDEAASTYASGDEPPRISKDPPPDEMPSEWELLSDDDEDGEVWMIKYPNIYPTTPE